VTRVGEEDEDEDGQTLRRREREGGSGSSRGHLAQEVNCHYLPFIKKAFSAVVAKPRYDRYHAV